MLTVIEKVIVLQNVDIFDRVDTEHLAYLAAIASEITIDADKPVYEEGDPAEALYVVLDGAVRLHREESDIAAAGPKDAFGTWARFDEKPRVASATATEATRLLKVDREDFVDLLADHVQITQGVLKTMVERLRGLLERVDVQPGGVAPTS